jgi:hypothetical protein
MLILDRLFSEATGNRVFQVGLNEEEYSLFSELFQKEFNRKTRMKTKAANQLKGAAESASKAAGEIGRQDKIVASMNKHGYTDISQLTGQYKNWLDQDPKLAEAVKARLGGSKQIITERAAQHLKSSGQSAQTARDIVVNDAKLSKSAVSEKGLDISGRLGNQKGSNVKVDANANAQATIVKGAKEGGTKSTVTHISDPNSNLTDRMKKKARAAKKRLVTGTSVNEDVTLRMNPKDRYKGRNTKARAKATQQAKPHVAEDLNKMMENWKPIENPSGVTVQGPKANVDVRGISGDVAKEVRNVPEVKYTPKPATTTEVVTKAAGEKLAKKGSWLGRNKKALAIGGGIAAGTGLGYYGYKKVANKA